MSLGDTFQLPQRHRVAGLAYGSMQSLRRGTGSDVAGSRAYLPGDDMRLIDRRASARYSSARGQDEWIVRQTYAEEAARVVVVADRRPSMALFPDGLPWLSKPRALARVAGLLCRSAVAAASLPGYLAVEDGEEPSWLPPGRSSFDDVAAAARRTGFAAPADALDRALSFLSLTVRLQTGSFVFLVSDFLAPPSEDALGDALARRWDVVPVVVQDARWERSFPEVAGALLPLVDPASGRARAVRLSRREVRQRREANEARFEALLDTFARFGLEPVVLDSDEPGRILAEFQEWSLRGSGGGRL